MAQRSGSPSAWRGAASWFAVAAALRLLFLGRFSLWGDEVYSFQDALALFGPETGAGDYAFPLFYLLERMVLELAGLADAQADPQALQWVLRLVPALAGALAAAAAFASPRDFLAPRERHVLAALVAFSPWLLWFSQWARFYTLLFALSIPASFELLRAARDRSVRRGVIASAWLLVATLVHPTALLLLFGHFAASAFAAAARLRPFNRGHVPLLLVPLVLALPVVVWPAVSRPVVYKWFASDAGVEGAGALLFGIGFNVGPLIGVLALLGIPSLWRRDPLLAVHAAVGAGAPMLLVVALAFAGKSVEQRYLVSILALALLPAATYVVELGELVHERAGAPRWIVLFLALASYAPGTVSNFIDGDRHDLAGAAAFVRERLRPGDAVIAETHGLFAMYLPDDFKAGQLLEAPPEKPRERAAYARIWKDCERIWVVIQADFERMSGAEPRFHEWAWTEGRLVRELWRPRLDYHQNRLRVFLVETARARRYGAPPRPGG